MIKNINIKIKCKKNKKYIPALLKGGSESSIFYKMYKIL